MDKVSVLRCGRYDPALLDAVIEKQFAQLEEGRPIIRAGARVVIKPNLVMRRHPDEATTTHPEFVAAIIRAVMRRGGCPVIAESPGGPYTKPALRTIYAGTGMTEIARREGAQLNFDLSTVNMPSDGGKKVHSFDVIAPVAQADVIISAAKLKTHGQMVYSGAVKNMFGSLPGLVKPEFHYRFPDKPGFAAMLVDLCETVRPALSFIDGIVGMEGNGPTGGAPKKLGLVFAGINPYAVDVAASAAAGFSVPEVPLLAEDVSRGLCAPELRQIAVTGDGAGVRQDFRAPDSISLDFAEKLPPFLRGAVGRLFTPRPVIVPQECVGCGKCAESCPQHTIAIRDQKAVIDYANCIKCFCCHEMCPHRSIEIKRFRAFGGGQ